MLGRLKRLLGLEEREPPAVISAADTRPTATPQPPARPRPQPNDGGNYRPAPIIESPYERGINVDYRRPGDEPHIRRINQPQPKGFPRKLHDWVTVRGTSVRQDEVVRFIAGTDRVVELRPEPDNLVSADALAVWGTWAEGGNTRTAQLGYVPDEVARELAGKLIGCRLEAMYGTRPGTSAGLRISIWGKRKKK